MKIKLKKIDEMDDWYTIVRVEHDGREWWEHEGNYSQWHTSERLTSDACIEGPSEHMIAIAHAIKTGSNEQFKRVAVHFETDGVHLWSPKNSSVDGVISVEDANEFADQVRLYFAAHITGTKGATE